MKASYFLMPAVATISLIGYFAYFSENNTAKTAVKISFNDDIRPILNENCTGCHGGVGKQANVSFIYRNEALGRGHSGRLTIVPGKPDASELIARVESKDPNIRMPYKAPALSPEKIQLLRDWIAQGAHWEEHWAFIKPQKTQPPNVNNMAVIANPIDNFIQAKLESKTLSLAPKATKTALLRRASLDLTGLPPTPEQIDAFIADTSANAYETQIDRLIASPHFGERWAAMWMDLARYADSWGFTRDEEREAWPYKQWLINSLNANKPFDEFITEQIAGDLIPNRSLDQLIATGFHRQTPANSEGGTDDEEYRMVAVMDRNATTWSVLNAMTINCVQCHSHPYDPIEHSEYFKSLSYFNTTHDADFRDYKPLFKFAKTANEKQRAFIVQENMRAIEQHEAQKAHTLSKQTHTSATGWEQVYIQTALGHEFRALKIYADTLEASFKETEKEGGTVDYRKKELLKIARARLKELNENNAQTRSLAVKHGEYFDSGSYEARVVFELQAKPATSPETLQTIRFSAVPQNPEKAKHTPEKSFHLENIKIFVAKPNGQRQQIAVKTFMANATEVMNAQLTALGEDISNNNGLHAGTGAGFFAHRLFKPRWTVAVLDQPLNLNEGDQLQFELYQGQIGVRGDQPPNRVHRIRIEKTHDQRWLQYATSETRRNQIAAYTQLKQALNKIDGYMVPVMYEQESWNQREMALFNRGNFIDKIGGKIAPDTPTIFPINDQPRNRLGLAKWFFKPDQPLTSRVTVNRFWHRLFGIGIVKTLEDFGSAGSPPSHPELLDWLAIEFQHNMKWNVKALLKLIVMSRTYQQASIVSPTLYELDPQNTLFARGPRQRLSAEMIRDQALVASGLMTHKIGGEPVMPPQPEGIWGQPGIKFKDWREATNENRYRRAIYTFVRRAFMYPSFLTFDMNTREISHERRITTNTPLQALVTLNDPVYHEASEALGKIMYEVSTNTSPGEAIQLGFKRVVSRQPDTAELAELEQGLKRITQEVKNHPSTGDTHTTIWTAMASILLNLDTALTR